MRLRAQLWVSIATLWAGMVYASTASAASWSFNTGRDPFFGQEIHMVTVQGVRQQGAALSCDKDGLYFMASFGYDSEFTQTKDVTWSVDGKRGTRNRWTFRGGSGETVIARPDVSRKILDAVLGARESLTLKYGRHTATFGVDGASDALARLLRACGL